MELFTNEHGEALRSAIMGMIILGITLLSISLLRGIMPTYDTSVEADNLSVLPVIEKSSPIIEGEEIIYVDYKSDFDISSVVTCKDYDGTLINEKLKIEGTVDTKKKGLYTLYLSVEGKKGYKANKKINVLVE